MRRSGVFLVMMMAIAVIAYGSARDGKVGLVLSGGGAKGIAHIGVIQALEENDIPMTISPGHRWVLLSEGCMPRGSLPPRCLSCWRLPDCRMVHRADRP